MKVLILLLCGMALGGVLSLTAPLPPDPVSLPVVVDKPVSDYSLSLLRQIYNDVHDNDFVQSTGAAAPIVTVASTTATGMTCIQGTR